MKNIQEIVKKVANRYDVEYDPHPSGPKVRDSDGTIKSLDISEMKKLFPKPSNDNKQWHQVDAKQEAKMKKTRVTFEENTTEYSIEELAVMSC